MMRPRRILFNGNFLTMDPARPRAWGITISAEGQIEHIWTDPVRFRLSGDVQCSNLRGRTVVPGFNDCHMHILPYGLALAKADLSPQAGVLDVAALVRALRGWCDANPESDWALGNRYDQNRFPGAKHPSRDDLDAAFADRPVYVEQTSGHAGAANSVALKVAGVTDETPDPPGGEIVRDAVGRPTGVLLEAAMELVTRHVPQPDRAGMVAAVHRACGELSKKGITAASDLHTGWLRLDEELHIYRQAALEGAPVTMTLYPHAPCFGTPDDVPTRASCATRFDDAPANLRLGPLKLFSDGALTTRTAALREPFIDGSGSGMLLHPPEELRAYVLAAHRGGWQLAIHAIGDRANELVLDCYEAAHASAQDAASSVPTAPGPEPNAQRRYRIEHAMLLDAGLIQRFVDLGVVPVIQPEFISRLGDAYVLGLGGERAARLNPVASLQRAGLGVAFSSDCPIVPGAPLDGIRAAVHRVTPSGRTLGNEERTTVEEALRSYTYWAAYSTFDEGDRGTIKPGCQADLVVLSADPTVDLDGAEVVATVKEGEVVFGEELW